MLGFCYWFFSFIPQSSGMLFALFLPYETQLHFFFLWSNLWLILWMFYVDLNRKKSYSLLPGYKVCGVSRPPLIRLFGSFASLFIFCPNALSWTERNILNYLLSVCSHLCCKGCCSLTRCAFITAEFCSLWTLAFSINQSFVVFFCAFRSALYPVTHQEQNRYFLLLLFVCICLVESA